ncbi:hypothetical protein E4U41_003588 [Claviceps citrina]|nr:hypothetical protein E4U41_003588 [Claviceps citrina]
MPKQSRDKRLDVQHQHSYGTTKYAVGNQDDMSSAWRSNLSNVARYNDVDCLFAAWFPETASELVRRSRQRLGVDIAGEEDNIAARNANATVPTDGMWNGGGGGGGSSGGTPGFLPTAFTPFFLDGGQTAPYDNWDEYFAINVPPLSSFSEQAGLPCPDVNGTETVDALLDCNGMFDLDTHVDCALWDTGVDGLMHLNPSAQPGRGIPEMAALLPAEQTEVERRPEGGETGREPGPGTEASLSTGRAREGLMNLETCLRAHLKDQLLQIKNWE